MTCPVTPPGVRVELGFPTQASLGRKGHSHVVGEASLGLCPQPLVGPPSEAGGVSTNLT